MNKIGISLLSALATLGIVGGAGAIALSTPAVKEKLNISFADNVLFGKGNKEEQIPEVKPENPKEESFSQGLANRNLVLVNYKIGDETIIRIQEKGSSVELFETPLLSGCTFIGWSDSEEDRKLVGIVEDGMTLYPVYISNSNHYIFEYYGLTSDMTNHVNTANQYFGDCNARYSNAFGTFTTYLLGFTDSADSKDMIMDFTNSMGNVYPVVYHVENKKVCSYNEWKEEYAIFQCGQSAMNNVKIHTFNGEEETKAYKVKIMIDSELDVDGIKFTLTGFSLSADSTSIVSPSNIVEGKSYYAVYESMSNYKVWSLNELKNGWDIVVHTSGSAMLTQCKYYEDLETFTHRFNANGIMFNLKGFSLAVDSTELIDSSLLNEEYCAENGIRHIYCVYERSDNLELYSSQALNELVRYRKASYVHYILDGEETMVNHVFLLDPFENDIEVNGVIYTFYGWSEDAGSEIISEVTKNHYHLYAVYQNSETGEISPITSIL